MDSSCLRVLSTRELGVALGLLAALLAPAAARAVSLSLSIEAQVEVSGTGGPNTIDSYGPTNETAANGPLSDSYFASAVDGLQTASAFPRGSADFGVLRAEVISQTTAIGDPGGALSEPASFAVGGVSLGFEDTLTVLGGTPGTQGSISLNFYVEGGASIGFTHPLFTTGCSGCTFLNFRGAVRLFGSSASAPLGVEDEIRFDIAGTGGSVVVGQMLEIDVPFVFGEPVDFGASLEVAALAQSISDPLVADFVIATSVTDFWHTARWGGITAVRDANGNPLASWSVSSASGTSYAAAFVPEPASASLLVAAACALAWSARRRRRDHPVTPHLAAATARRGYPPAN
jgi:hypothetical protein